jgi:hypothetical protein
LRTGRTLVLVDEGDLRRLQRSYGAVRVNKNVLLTTTFGPRSIYADADNWVLRSDRIRVGLFDRPIEVLVRKALSKAWGRDAWIASSDGEEVGDGVYCDAMSFGTE